MRTLLHLQGMTILFIIPTIILAAGDNPTAEFKALVNFDISGPLHKYFEMVPSKEHLGGANYTIRGSYRHTHILGDVMDGKELLQHGDPRAISRYVLVHPRKDGSKYIRMIMRPRENNGTTRIVDEFVKPIGLPYRPINRTPVDIDILTQENDQYIHTELIADWSLYDQHPGIIPEDIETMPIMFSIQENVQDNVVIGVVKFGQHILEKKVDGLMERKVTWEGGLEAPTVTITSRYKDGTEIENQHRFEIVPQTFIPRNLKKRFIKFYE